MFDRNGFDPFARSRRNSLSKKSKMKQMKQQVAPSVVKQADYSQVGGKWKKLMTAHKLFGSNFVDSTKSLLLYNIEDPLFYTLVNLKTTQYK